MKMKQQNRDLESNLRQLSVSSEKEDLGYSFFKKKTISNKTTTPKRTIKIWFKTKKKKKRPPEIEPESIEMGVEIGTGSFGKVFKGRCRQKDVAIKVLHKQNFDQKTMEAFRREVKIMR